MLVKIYTDGAARGNPDGPGGYGCVLHYTMAGSKKDGSVERMSR